MKRFITLCLAITLTLGSLGIPAPVQANHMNAGFMSPNSDGLGDADMDICFDSSGVWTSALQAVVISGFSIWKEALSISITNWGTSCIGFGADTRNVKVVWTTWTDCALYTNAARTGDGLSTGDTYIEIWYNSACPNFTWYVGNNPVVYGYMDAESIATHEFGHALGMADHGTPPHAMSLGVDCVWSRQMYHSSTSQDLSTEDVTIRTKLDGSWNGYTTPNVDKSGTGWNSTITCIE